MAGDAKQMSDSVAKIEQSAELWLNTGGDFEKSGILWYKSGAEDRFDTDYEFTMKSYDRQDIIDPSTGKFIYCTVHVDLFVPGYFAKMMVGINPTDSDKWTVNEARVKVYTSGLYLYTPGVGVKTEVEPEKLHEFAADKDTLWFRVAEFFAEEERSK